MRIRARFFACLLTLAAIATPAAAQVGTLYTCPLNGGGDQLDRGFYVTSYPGYSLNGVTITYYNGSGDGDYTISLTARLSTYDGTIVGATQTRVVTITGGGPVPATFDFGGAAVPFGSTVTFTQVLVSGPGATPFAFYDVGTGPCAGITETNGTSPPLDTFRRDSMGVTITGATSPFVPVSAVSVPAMGETALALTTALLALIGVVAMRRRQRRR